MRDRAGRRLAPPRRRAGPMRCKSDTATHIFRTPILRWLTDPAQASRAQRSPARHPRLVRRTASMPLNQSRKPRHLAAGGASVGSDLQVRRRRGTLVEQRPANPGADLKQSPLHPNRIAVERARIDFLVQRDGIAAAVRWVRRTIGIYRRAVLGWQRHSGRHEYRLRFIQSYCVFKAWLGGVAAPRNGAR